MDNVIQILMSIFSNLAVKNAKGTGNLKNRKFFHQLISEKINLESYKNTFFSTQSVVKSIITVVWIMSYRF